MAREVSNSIQNVADSTEKSASACEAVSLVIKELGEKSEYLSDEVEKFAS